MLMAPWDEGVAWYATRTVPATDRAVDLSYVRDDHLRVTTGNVEDARIDRAIRAATEQAEAETQRAILPQTWELHLSRFPIGARPIEFPLPPLIEVTSVSYTDENGDAQTLSLTTDYTASIQAGDYARRSRIDPVIETVWPATRRIRDAVVITFRCGYEDGSVSPAVADVPESLKEGIAMRAAELYKQRSDSVIGVGTTVTPALVASQSLFAQFAVY